MVHTEYRKCSIPAPSLINVVEFCPFETASTLIAFATTTNLNIRSVTFSEPGEVFKADVSQDHAFSLSYTGIECISWSANSNTKYLPRCAKVAFGTDNGHVCVVSTDFKEDINTLTLNGHRRSVNAVAFNPVGYVHLLASCGDDHTCRIWDTENKVLLTVLPLQYAGIDLSWNVQNAGKLMVAELSGTIRFYAIIVNSEENWESKSMKVLKCNKGTLVAANWSQINPNKIGAAVGNQYVIWDLSKSGLPDELRQCHSGGTTTFRWSNFDHDVFLTQGRPKHGLKVHRFGHREILLHEVKSVGSGISWHCKLPLIAVADNGCVEFIDLTTQVAT